MMPLLKTPNPIRAKNSDSGKTWLVNIRFRLCNDLMSGMRRFISILILFLVAGFSGIASAWTNKTAIPARIANRSFPSVFQAWNPADNLNEPPIRTMARHDLVFKAPQDFDLRWSAGPEGLAANFVAKSIFTARELRKKLLRANPNILLLAEIRYRDAANGYLPENHRWWKRDAHGQREAGWAEGGYWLLDFAQPEFQNQIVSQARAIIDTGIFDGIMLDCWDDDDARLVLIEKLRAALGDKFLILVNANDRETPRTAPFANGYFMECYRSSTVADWQRIAETLRWTETHLASPHINCLETWYRQSRQDLSLMRATTTLSLTLSDGYCLFSDPNPLPTPDHLHDWYPFWDKTLGQPLGNGSKYSDGSWRREFKDGTAIYNPAGNSDVKVRFLENRLCRSTGKIAREFLVASCDGDLFLRER
jgi:hypothetical protein